MLHRLNGMFALAIWDRVERKLFLACDSMGVKPLYFSHHPKGRAEGLYFGSEPKTLFVAGVPWAKYFRTIPALRDCVEQLPHTEPIASGPFVKSRLQTIVKEFLATRCADTTIGDGDGLAPGLFSEPETKTPCIP